MLNVYGSKRRNDWTRNRFLFEIDGLLAVCFWCLQVNKAVSTQFTTHILNSKLVFGTYVNEGRPNILRWHSRPCTLSEEILAVQHLCNGWMPIHFLTHAILYSIPVPLVAYCAFPMANHKIANDSRLAVSIQNNKRYRFTNSVVDP